MVRNYHVITLFYVTSITSRHRFILRMPSVAIFADFIRIITIFIKTILKDSRKVKRVKNYVSKHNPYLHFLIQQNFLISIEKMLISAELKECVTGLIYILDLLQVKYNCQVSSVLDMCDRGGRPLCPLSVSSPKKVHPEQG